MPRWRALSDELDPQVREFAVQLRRLVDRSGLSIAAVADRTGYSKTSWERYLNGRLLAPKGAIVALAEVTGTHPIHLTTMWELAERAWSRSEMRHDMTMEAIRISQARAALAETGGQSTAKAPTGTKAKNGRTSRSATATPGVAGPAGVSPTVPPQPRSPGDRPSGDRPSGDRPSGDRHSEGRQSGDRPSGARQPVDRPSMDRQSVDRWVTDRPPVDRPFGERSQGERFPGERLPGERSSGEPRPSSSSPSPSSSSPSSASSAAPSLYGGGSGPGAAAGGAPRISWGMTPSSASAQSGLSGGPSPSAPSAPSARVPGGASAPPPGVFGPPSGGTGGTGSTGGPGGESRTGSGPDAGDPSPKRRMSMFLAGAVGTLVVIAGAFYLTSGGDKNEAERKPPTAQQTTPATNPDLPAGVKCGGKECGGKDPEAMGCIGDLVTTTATKFVGTAKVEVRYSETCQAAWGRLTQAGQGDEVQVTVGTTKETAAIEAAGDNIAYTQMITVEDASEATACATLATGQKACTD
ncbi:helix-turn-helix domain-containing protein [Streptomyces sp. NPDC002643]